MHRFNMGNDNPIQNSKLLREAFQQGRRQALNETSMGGGPSMQQAPPMNSMGTPVPPQNRMGMGVKGRGFGGFGGFGPEFDKYGNPYGQSIPGTKSPPEGVPPVGEGLPSQGFSPQPGGMYYVLDDGTVVYGTPGGNGPPNYGRFEQHGTWTPPKGPWRWTPTREREDNVSPPMISPQQFFDGY